MSCVVRPLDVEPIRKLKTGAFLRERFGLRHTSDEAFGMSAHASRSTDFLPADLIGVPEVDLLGG